ncbi:diguanylate cyclase [Parahaliea maris]|uniref:Diguanylate cyclase n=1 Tax=Parahaliea maris TaxID=2716870 RepID=A0A5C9A6X4_9GAMM|nr:diguanylate cyclase [Parahaliea maris]TXS95337.1 diguanylate cyclase [Parahaliea maris]
MTTTTRTRLAAMAVVLVSSLVLGAACARVFYQQELQDITARAHTRVDQRADLQWLIYTQQAPALQRQLQELTRHPAVVRADVYSGLGDHMAGHPAGRPPDLDKLRGSASLNAEVLQGLDDEGGLKGTSWFATLLSSGATIHLNLPVITRINHDAKGLTGQDFVQAVTRASGPGSDIVMGYVDFTIDPEALRAVNRPLVLGLVTGWMVLAALAAGALLVAGLRQQEQLRSATRIVDDLANREQEVTLPEGGNGASGEFNHALRRLADSLGRYTQELETGKHLLNRKVEERTSQLSRSNEELNRASEAVSASREQLQRLTYYDHLTTLPNRQLFLEQLDLLLRLSRRSQQHLSLLHVDLANFRQINELEGFHVGDLLLREVAGRLKQCVRDSDTVATTDGSEHDISVSRLGGDEFTVVLNQLDKPESAQQVAERIVKRLQEPLTVDDRSVAVQTCIGVACFPQHGDSAEALLKGAAVALKVAKQNPAQPVAICSAALMAAQQETDTDAHWREALQDKRLCLRYTPVVDTVMGSVVALDCTVCCPAPAAEDDDNGWWVWDGSNRDRELALALTAWQFETACAEVARLSASTRQAPRLRITLRASQLGPDISEQLASALIGSKLPVTQLELNLREEVLAEGRFGELITELQEAEVCLSVTGFGQGRASLQQFCDSRITTLSLAPELAPQYSEKTDSGAVRALISTARSLNRDIIAEGVSEASDYHYLAPQGVRQMSGALFASDLTAEQAAAMLAPWHFIELIRQLGTNEMDQGEARTSRL